MKKITIVFTVSFYFTFLFSFVIAQQEDILWSEDFEGDWTQNWYVDGGVWEIGIPTYGPDTTHGGMKCAATVLDGNYPDDQQSWLIRFTWFTVPSVEDNPRLRFWHWYSFHNGDYGNVQIKTPSSDWIQLSNSFEGNSSYIWANSMVDLTAYADSLIQIAFFFQSSNYQGGNYDVSSGWYIDDLELRTGSTIFNNPEGWEEGIGDWWVSDGTWEVGEPTSGPGSTFNGSNCLATVLDGNYSDAADNSHFISPWITVPSATENPRLRFWHWYSFHNGDYGNVQIKTPSSDWIQLSNSFEGNSSYIWANSMVDLTAYADSLIQIAFFFHSGNYQGGSFDESSGWYIDDLELRTGSTIFNNPEGWEEGIGDWWVSDGTWEVGEPTSGPGSTFNGSNCLATVLDGNYSDAADNSHFISPWITVPSATENPRLRFWHWYSFHNGDYGNVQIKTPSSDWIQLSNSFEGNSSYIWANSMVDLTAYADSLIQIAFFFHSGNYQGGSFDESSGWYIDDLELRTGSTIFNNPEGWEEGIGDWWVSDGTWEVGEPTSGPGSAFNGSNCLATVLDGNYSDAADNSHFISPWITVPSATENPRLRFWHWYSFHNGDYGNVQIKTPSSDWIQLSNSFEGNSSYIWANSMVDLTAYADSLIQIAFFFHSGNYQGGSFDESSGWYIDDLELRTGSTIFNNPEGWEEGIGDWWVSDGTWEVGEPTSGPGSAFNGSNCLATVLDGNYSDAADNSHFISPWITVPSATENPRLRFWHWYSFHNGDYGNVQIKTPSSDWIIVSNNFEGNSGGVYSYMYVDLISYADSLIRVAFFFHSGNYQGGSFDESSGWYIDDLILEDDSDLSVDAGPDKTIIYGASTTLDASVSGGTPPYTFKWAPVEGLDDPSVLNPVASPSDSTLYTITVTDDHGCFRTDNVWVNVLGGTGIVNSEIEKVNIYPNPFISKTAIEFDNPNNENFTFSIFDISGYKVYQKINIKTSSIDFERGNLPKGIYIIELAGPKRIRSKIIIK